MRSKVTLILMTLFFSFSSMGFHILCESPDGMQITIESNPAHVLPGNDGYGEGLFIYNEYAVFNYKRAGENKVALGTGINLQMYYSNGKATFYTEGVQFSYQHIYPKNHKQNSLVIEGKHVFENIDLTCTEEINYL